MNILMGLLDCYDGPRRFFVMSLMLIVASLIHHIALADDIAGQFATDEGYQVFWNIDQNNFYANITIPLPTLGWVALGISSGSASNAMFGADVIVGFTDDLPNAYRAQLGTTTASVLNANDLDIAPDSYLSQNPLDYSWTLTIVRPLNSETSTQIYIEPSNSIPVILAWRDGSVSSASSNAIGMHTGTFKTIINNKGIVYEKSSAHQNSASNGEIKLDDGFTMKYAIESSSIVFTATLKSQRAWIGLGLSNKANSMTGSWAVIGTPSSGSSSSVDAYLINSMSMPSIDSQTDELLSSASCTYSGSDTILKFTRPLYLDSGLDPAFDVDRNGRNHLVWAYGSGTVISRHAARGSSLVDWSTGVGYSSSAGGSVRKAHGSFMYIAWMIMVPSAVIIARFFKDDQGKWFQYHRALMVGAVALSSMSFILIVSSVDSGRHFSTVHGTIGLIVQLVAVVHPIIAIFRYRFRALWEKQHRWTGAALYIAASLNCFLGAGLLNSALSKSTFNGFIAIAFIGAMGAFINLQFRKGKSVAHKTAHRDLADEEHGRVRLNHVSE